MRDDVVAQAGSAGQQFGAYGAAELRASVRRAQVTQHVALVRVALVA